MILTKYQVPSTKANQVLTPNTTNISNQKIGKVDEVSNCSLVKLVTNLVVFPRFIGGDNSEQVKADVVILPKI